MWIGLVLVDAIMHAATLLGECGETTYLLQGKQNIAPITTPQAYVLPNNHPKQCKSDCQDWCLGNMERKSIPFSSVTICKH